jgi:hypothetical protein
MYSFAFEPLPSEFLVVLRHIAHFGKVALFLRPLVGLAGGIKQKEKIQL